jgi:hypothetical protein
MSLVSYGAVQRFGPRSRSVEGALLPPGEDQPMHEIWARRFAKAAPDELRDLVTEAEAELDAWVRRPLVPDTVETLEELCARIVDDGWGVTAAECARAMLTTPTLVRNARLAAGRHPESGYHLPAPSRDAWAWAEMLDRVGLNVRQIATLTGLPKSTLHDRLGGRRRQA